jgi:hypothetical protein
MKERSIQKTCGRILFQNGGSIAAMNPDGSNVKTILAQSSGVSYEAPAGAADGRIAFIRDIPAGG